MARHDHQGHARAAAVYGLAGLIVLAVGSIAIWSFVERQSVRRTLAPEPLPAVTIVTGNPDSALGAAWVDLLSKAQFAATLVPIEKYEPAPGLLAIADLESLPPPLARGIEAKLREGGGLIVLGAPPEGADASPGRAGGAPL